jgi:ribosomal protein S18 acetylase RimI-like enzyme
MDRQGNPLPRPRRRGQIGSGGFALPPSRPRLRDARPADLGALVALEAACFPGDRISAASFRRLTGRPSAALRLATAGGALLGYSLLLFRKRTTVARLYSIAVAGEARGLGIGRRLMQDAARLAGARGADRLRLEVRRDNRAAIRLYEGLGYRPIGTYPGYYADGMEALRLERRLRPAGAGKPRKPS